MLAVHSSLLKNKQQDLIYEWHALGPGGIAGKGEMGSTTIGRQFWMCLMNGL